MLPVLTQSASPEASTAVPVVPGDNGPWTSFAADDDELELELLDALLEVDEEDDDRLMITVLLDDDEDVDDVLELDDDDDREISTVELDDVDELDELLDDDSSSGANETAKKTAPAIDPLNVAVTVRPDCSDAKSAPAAV